MSARRPHASLRAAVEARRILVVCGPGGVGKTTTSAALALRAAAAGRRVLVCTIDPSRRLATSLGLGQLPGEPRRIPTGGGGELWAMMLDTRRTFDALVERYAPGEEARRRILENRFYRHVSAALAGSHEYMAMERLLELSSDGRFDLVVLDTPPTRHALDFLDAPDRLMAVLDTSVLRWFLKPYFVAGRLTLKVATRTGALALRLADRYLGLQFLQDLSEFFLAFEGLYDGFKERAARVFALLRRPDTGFVVAASPAREALEEALYFHGRLVEKKMPFVGFVVNRLHADPAAAPTPGRTAAAAAPTPVPEALAAKLAAVFKDYQALARAEARRVARLEVDSREPVVRVPELEGDVHDLRGLREVAEALLPPERARARVREG